MVLWTWHVLTIKWSCCWKSHWKIGSPSFLARTASDSLEPVGIHVGPVYQVCKSESNLSLVSVYLGYRDYRDEILGDIKTVPQQKAPPADQLPHSSSLSSSASDKLHWQAALTAYSMEIPTQLPIRVIESTHSSSYFIIRVLVFHMCLLVELIQSAVEGKTRTSFRMAVAGSRSKKKHQVPKYRVTAAFFSPQGWDFLQNTSKLQHFKTKHLHN